MRISEILGHLHVFFLIPDGATGFLDENWSSIVKKIKKSKFDLNSLYKFQDFSKSDKNTLSLIGKHSFSYHELFELTIFTTRCQPLCF